MNNQALKKPHGGLSMDECFPLVRFECGNATRIPEYSSTRLVFCEVDSVLLE